MANAQSSRSTSPPWTTLQDQKEALSVSMPRQVMQGKNQYSVNFPKGASENVS